RERVRGCGGRAARRLRAAALGGRAAQADRRAGRARARRGHRRARAPLPRRGPAPLVRVRRRGDRSNAVVDRRARRRALPRPVAVDVVLELLCCAGVVVMRTTFDRLHYAAAGTTIPAFFVLAAVLVREHLSSGGLQAIAAVALMFLLNPVLVIATARAARRIDYDTVAPLPEERAE